LPNGVTASSDLSTVFCNPATLITLRGKPQGEKRANRV
jgi:hypothetical protein